MADLKIIGISGSLRKNSYNTALIRAAQELTPEGTTFEIVEIGELPLFNEDHEQDPPQVVKDLKAKIEAADAVVFATPEYNYTIPGVLKNAIDWASRPYGNNSWAGKTAAVMGASIGGIATARAQYDLRKTFVFLNVHDVKQPEVMVAQAQNSFDEQGNLTNEDTKKFIRQQLEALVELTRKLQG
ncbi:NADPH-dependent FMN reductase [Deinococcus radiophilus]|uniref:NAD(P)H-dependent oxidoreductase n=1 Tax=Deinococcus radiophilus TaxID=32062 RepID=A0A431VQM4_9DEIO|nr:NADPH-dependent FMN reductase [Deinococcus radiophilus]RTR25497.1 NAD(P)H-dependent oxidoreductase [Deinococcus radiophilus]UFA51737.1 NAD(P)H-dependent oxidoreductase [Deinococcus radiophilus]